MFSAVHRSPDEAANKKKRGIRGGGSGQWVATDEAKMLHQGPVVLIYLTLVAHYIGAPISSQSRSADLERRCCACLMRPQGDLRSRFACSSQEIHNTTRRSCIYSAFLPRTRL